MKNELYIDLNNVKSQVINVLNNELNKKEKLQDDIKFLSEDRSLYDLCLYSLESQVNTLMENLRTITYDITMKCDELSTKKNELEFPSENKNSRFSTYENSKKSNEEIADEVINGNWGNGEERKRRLAAAGYSYEEIQAIVNNKLYGTRKTSNKKSNEEIADEVMDGNWGNGEERKRRLADAGYNYEEIQTIVNNRLYGTRTISTQKSNEQIADEVMKGIWGNGEERKTKLIEAGYNFIEIQAIVNSKISESGKTTAPQKSNEEIANEVMSGIWGNGEERKTKLAAAGYNYLEIQAIINNQLSKSTPIKEAPKATSVASISNSGKMQQRTTKPEAGNKFYNTTSKGGYSTCRVGSPTDPNCNVLSNCVGYACGRFNEIIGSMQYPDLNCNAADFVTRAKSLGLQVVNYPVIGGIMVWDRPYQHVAVVEQINDNGSIVTSESSYGGAAFKIYTRSGENYRITGGNPSTFIGCIVNPAIGLVTR